MRFQLYEKNAETKIALAIELVKEADEDANCSAKMYLINSLLYAQELIEKIESHSKDWLSVHKGDRTEDLANKVLLIDELYEEVELTNREFDREQYRLRMKKFTVTPSQREAGLHRQEGHRRRRLGQLCHVSGDQSDRGPSHISSLSRYRWRI